MPAKLLQTAAQAQPAAPLPVLGWTCYIFQITTGQIMTELPLDSEPQYTRMLNDAGQGSIQVTVPIGGTGANRDIVREYVGGWKFGLALSWGPAPSGFIVQAGPIITHAFDDTTAILTLSCGTLWSYLNHLYQINSGWTTAAPITDPSADTTYNGSYHDITISILTNALALQSLPLSLPSTDGLGGWQELYFGYDLAMVGQRLQQLVQLNQAPEIDFYPAFTDSAHVGWTALIGTPLIPNSGAVFDYGAGLISVKTDGDASNLTNYAWVKGNGSERGLLYGNAILDSSILNGWPRLDFVDSSGYTSETVQQNLNNAALADLALFYAPVELWTCTVRADQYPVFGSYTPGSSVTMSLQGHPWIPDGQYSGCRLISMTQGQNASEVVLNVQAFQGIVI